MSSGASVSALQRLVEQLKLEAGVERIKVSQAAAELQQYCMQNACKDALLLGVPAGSNPLPGAQILCFTLKTGKPLAEEAFVHMVTDDCDNSQEDSFQEPGPKAKTLQKSCFLNLTTNFTKTPLFHVEPESLCLGYRHVLFTGC